MQAERRRAERDRRESWRVSAVCAVRNVVGDGFHLSQSEDIGPGGMTLRRPRDLPMTPQTSVSLTFDLPGTRQTVTVEGMVVSDRLHGGFRRTGIRFVGHPAERAPGLLEFCSRRG